MLIKSRILEPGYLGSDLDTLRPFFDHYWDIDIDTILCQVIHLIYYSTLIQVPQHYLHLYICVCMYLVLYNFITYMALCIYYQS